jgi:hypothetical protein
MEISDFKMTRELGNSIATKAFVAEVTVTEGWGPWKKSRRVEIARDYGGAWFFLETGELTPAWRVEVLEKAASMRARIAAI